MTRERRAATEGLDAEPIAFAPARTPGKDTLISSLGPLAQPAPAASGTAATTEHAATPTVGNGAPSSPISAASLPPRRASERAIDLAQVGTAHIAAIETTLVPPFRRAVAAMDLGAVRALAAHIVSGVSQVHAAQVHIGQLVPQADPHAERVSGPETDPFTPDAVELASVIGFKSMLDTAFTTAFPVIATGVSPQMFGNELVGGAAEAPPEVGRRVEYIAYEASQVIEMLEEADTIAGLVMPEDARGKTSVPASDADRATAIDRLDRQKHRPINFMFLARVLKERGVWPALQESKGTSGRDAKGLEQDVAAQAAETGRTPDVGTWWDPSDAHDALTYGATDWAVTDANAMDVFEMLAHAEPRARGPLVKQLHRRGLLDRMCANLPWGRVKELSDTILDDDEASKLLAPYWEGKGGGKSLGKTLRGLDHWYTDALDTGLDLATLGAKPMIDRAHDDREAGLISDDAYWWTVDKAVARAGMVGAAALATGAVAGELVGGFAEGMGASEGGAAMAGSVAGGAVGSTYGHVAGDVYDQALNGKEGFDSPGDYAKTFLTGGAAGLVAGGVGMGAAKYLPEASRTMAQEFSVRHPQLSRVMEAARGVGVGSAVRVRMTVAEITKTLGGGGGGLPPGMAFATAGASMPALDGLPPDAEVWVTVRPLKDLNAPAAMQSSGGSGTAGGAGPGGRSSGDLVEVEAVEVEATPRGETEPASTSVPDSELASAPQRDRIIRPSTEPDPGAIPGGTPAKISARSDEATARSLAQQNKAAEVLAKNGYKIIQNRERSSVPGEKQPDYTIDGEPFDAYAPSTSKAHNIVETLRAKQGSGQADRFVLDLSLSAASVDEIAAALRETPVEGLIQIIGIRGDDVFLIWPQG